MNWKIFWETVAALSVLVLGAIALDTSKLSKKQRLALKALLKMVTRNTVAKQAKAKEDGVDLPDSFYVELAASELQVTFDFYCHWASGRWFRNCSVETFAKEHGYEL